MHLCTASIETLYLYHMQWIDKIPTDLTNFVLVTIFALLIGLEQRRHHWDEKPETLYGTDRTFTFIGILGFVLYILSPDNLLPFLAGGFALVVLLAIFYSKRIEYQNKYGFTSIIVVLITYSLAPLIYREPIWLSLLVVTTVLIITEIKPQLHALTGKFDNDEFIILAKFLVISGIVLPLLPHTVISPTIPISPFKIWLAVVVISGISYLSYLIQRFLFPKKSILITGALGGLYSSTATTLVLARKSKESQSSARHLAASILLATAMMFIRILLLVLIFNEPLAAVLILPLGVLSLLTFLMAWLVYKLANKDKKIKSVENSHKNPLEFKTALLFAGLFLLFALITKYVLETYGTQGLNLLSVVVGVTDIDPFLLGLFTGKYHIALQAMSQATLIAVTSNNLLKLGYALFLGGKDLRKPLLYGFLAITIVSLAFILL